MRCILSILIIICLLSCGFIDRPTAQSDEVATLKHNQTVMLPQPLRGRWRARTLLNRFVEVNLCDSREVRILTIIYRVDSVTRQPDWSSEFSRDEILAESTGFRQYTNEDLQRFKLLNFAGHERYKIQSVIDYRLIDINSQHDLPLILVNRDMKVFLMIDGEEPHYQRLEFERCGE